ncbi:uncharacterized protein C8A04DRAFT_26816 [Dichotomopilus funicola]|uniref:C2H2-type domain-containing protein n=1 Tax=Dichotomopilus funicola TaxID=1934379 RepID=A0AAN6ZQB6_9PEZI|nr:hypothetical protein C8A04DRAFT_26816 [Dichotomopilus funicola]
MATTPGGSRLGSGLSSFPAPRPPSPTPSSNSTPFSFSTSTAKSTFPPSLNVLTPSGTVSNGFPTSGSHASNSHTTQTGGPLYYSGHMTGSWPTPGLSQPSAYTYGNSGAGATSSGNLAQPPYNRTPTSYGSAPSPSHQHFPGRASSSAPNGESLPAPHPYQSQQNFSSPVGAGSHESGGGNGLGSPLSGQGGNQSGLGQSMLGNPSPDTARQGQPGQAGTQDSGPYRPPTSPYYPHTSAPQQSGFPSYSSPLTQPSPTTSSTMPSGSVPRGAPSTPAMVPPMQYPGGRTHSVAPMASYPPYSQVPGPVMSNMHHPGAPLAMVGGMSGLSNYNNHPGMSHHPHPLYVHHPGGPAPQSERPFKCNECQQAFNRNHDLKRHQRIHLAVKPFGCPDCEKRFSRKDALKRHKLVKGCGNGASPPGAGNATTGGSENTSDDRSTTTAGGKSDSPTMIKKEA